MNPQRISAAIQLLTRYADSMNLQEWELYKVVSIVEQYALMPVLYNGRIIEVRFE